jgi:hypothetical protein
MNSSSLSSQSTSSDCLPPLSPLKTDVHGYQYCAYSETPLTIFDPGRNNSSPTSSIGWNKFADRVGKPGWISSEGQGAYASNLTFQVKVNETNPRLEVTFLMSYNHTIPAYMNIRGCTPTNNDILLKNKWDEKLSIGRTHSWSRFLGSSSLHSSHYSFPFPCPNIDLGATLTITFRIADPIGAVEQKGKFKILSIVSC